MSVRPGATCLPLLPREWGFQRDAPLVRACVARASVGRPWADYRSSMATIVLRVRLLGGEHTDLTYEDPDQVDEDEMVEQVIEVLSEESAVLRCRHGDRVVALYSRGVASIEVSPRGAIL